MTVISISIPDDLRRLLDAEATRQRRSRSFIVGEAVREYVASINKGGLEEFRDRTLRDNLKLSLTERVRRAEALGKEATRGVPRQKPFTISFESWAEFDEWRRQGEPLPTDSVKRRKTRSRTKSR